MAATEVFITPIESSEDKDRLERLEAELKELRESLAWLVNEKTQRIEALEADNKKLRLELDDVKMELKRKADVVAAGGGISAIRAAMPRDAPEPDAPHR